MITTMSVVNDLNKIIDLNKMNSLIYNTCIQGHHGKSS